MKKFISSMLLIAVAIISATSFTSCNKDEEPVINKQQDNVAVVAYGCTPDFLDFYNVSIKMTDTANKTQTLNLTPANATKENGNYFFLISLETKNFPVKVDITTTCAKKLDDIVDDQKYNIENVYVRKKTTTASSNQFFMESITSAGHNLNALSGTGASYKKISSSGKTWYERIAETKTLSFEI